MAVTHRAGKFAILLHADVAGSTSLVHQDEHLAHERIQTTFRRFGDTIARYHGRVRELRGDALLAEFERASDAVTAALAFQAGQTKYNAQIEDDIRPTVRVGIAMGEVVFADRTVTGAGVVLAQRMEQLAESGGVCITAAIHESLPQRMPFDQKSLGEKEVKGFEEPVRAHSVRLQEGVEPPGPVELSRGRRSTVAQWAMTAAMVVLVCGGGLLAWYQFSAPESEPASPERMAYPLPDKPSIAVLPFANIGNDAEQEYLADGITSDLITDLSKFGDLFVVAANSSFTYKGKPVQVQQVAEELGVQYLLEGSVQRVGDTIRINAQLIDALSGHHLWAERYDREAGDFFAIQDEILKTIIGTLQPQVTDIEKERAFKRPTENLTAYDYFKRGVAYSEEWKKESNSKAREMQEKAIELDPEYARAYSNLGFIHANDWLHDWSEDRAQSRALALQYARKGVELDPDDYWNIWGLARIYGWFGQTDLARSNYDRALSLNPYDPELLMNVAELQVSIGKAEQGVKQVKTAMRYNPRYPDGAIWLLGWIQYFAGQHEEAVATLQRMTNPPNGVRRTLAAALVQVGRVDEAREMIEEFVKNAPEYTLADIKRQPIHRSYIDKWVKDLRTAGLPE